MKNFDKFAEVYRKHLTKAMTEHPDEYMKHLTPDALADHMLGIIKERKGVGLINIDSRSFRGAAKEFGIKNTYRDWNGFFGG